MTSATRAPGEWSVARVVGSGGEGGGVAVVTGSSGGRGGAAGGGRARERCGCGRLRRAARARRGRRC
ncbi:hypothetical protein F1544_11770 [Kineosporiaceae bacterium B12]|nr:hypothetical protein [Kineococcus rubinsiae]